MPMTPGADVGTGIKEFRTGSHYRHTKKKYGKKRAEKQALAVALKESRTPAKSRHKHRKAQKG